MMRPSVTPRHLAALQHQAYGRGMNTQRRPRLNRDDWLSAGLSALCEQGPGALGAEPLARRVGATKGSFYWHFTDVPAYNLALLDLWESAARQALESCAQTDATDAARLRATAQTIAATSTSDEPASRAEPAIRAWARDDTSCAAAVTRVDEARLDQLHVLLSACGIGNAEMARILYASAIGMEELRDRDAAQNSDAIGSLVDLVLALR